MASATDLTLENKQLNTKVQELMDDLEDKENQLVLSAQLGKELLENNSKLTREIEEIQESNLLLTEELRQENHILKLKIDGNVRARENFTHEMETLKEKLQEKAKQELARVTACHEKKSGELQVEIENLQAEIEKGSLVTEQLQEKISKQEEMLAEAHKYSKQLKGMGALESQLEELKEEYTLMRFKNDELKIMLTDVNDQKEQLLFGQQSLVQKTDALKENLEEKTTQGKIWFDALQDSRQQVSELQMEVSTLKAELLNRSHKEKGNSLFGEVEDKRLALEQKYSAISAKYESLQKTHQIVKRQLHQLKTQILPMLQMAANQADSSKIKRLEAALSQSRSEMKRLYVKIKDLERENEERGVSTRLQTFHDAFSDFKDQKDYITYLQNEIKCLKETVGDLKSQGEITTVKLLAETGKKRETESLLHTSEVKKEKLEHEVVRLRLKLDELKIKLQQDGKISEQIREHSHVCENNRSIWKDDSLFAKPEASQYKTSSSRKVPALRQPLDQIRETQSSTEVKANSLQTVETTESQPCKKVKPVGRVLPMNGNDLASVDNSKLPSVLNSKSRPGKEQNISSEIVPLAESNRALLPPDQSDPNAGKKDGTSQNSDNGEKYEETENMRTSKENTKKAVRRQSQPRRIIRVKDTGSKNECQQQ